MPPWMRSSVKRLDYPVYRNLWEIMIMDYEKHSCAICGKTMKFYYDEMR